MLDRLGFSSGEIDGRVGVNLRRAVAAFRRAHGLPASDAIDQTLWQRLNERAGNQPPLVTYELTASDVAGPFSRTFLPT